MVRKLLVAGALVFICGCGGFKEVPPTAEAAPEMSPEEQERVMKESMERGNRSGAPGGGGRR